MSVEENKALVRRFFEAFFANDAAALEEVTSQDVVYHTAPPGLSAGIQGYRELMAMYHGAFADLRLTIDDMIAEGDKVVTRFTGSGTHRGDFMGVAPTGKQAAAGAISIVRVAGGKVTEEWDQLDLLGLLQQLGAIPVPGEPSTTTA
ncbi:MAG: ester cyclase [Chloroflexota bacterium]|nr:ester cyclase [Chloroflexota bacterium]